MQEETEIKIIYNSKLNLIYEMFKDCHNITELDLSNFDTSEVTDMHNMLENCYSLTSINLKNFDTSKVTNMKKLFLNCNSLLSLDLTSFNTSNIKSMSYMFSGCNSLIYINLFSFEFNSSSVSNIFNDNLDYLIYCINEEKAESISNFLKGKGIKNNCDNLCFMDSHKLIVEDKKCVIDCSQNEFDKYLYQNKCYNICPENTTISKNNFCEFLSTDQMSPIIIDDNIKDLKTKNISDILIEDLDTNCPEDFPYKNISDDKCISKCNAKDFFEKICSIPNKVNNKKENTIKAKEEMISNIQSEIINGKLDSLLINVIENKKEDILVIKKDDIIYQLISSDNKKINEYKNISSIKLDECEIKLKQYYNISENETLLILKIDDFIEGFVIPIILYEVYNFKTKEKLDLNICKNETINISIPVSIKEDNLFKYNKSNEYYNDECYPYTTMKGTDITLNDRKQEFIDNKMSPCEADCEYKEYDKNLNKVLCKCNIKYKLPLISEIQINKDKLLDNAFNFKKIFNLNTMKCINIIFTKEGLKNNIGNYTILIILLFNFILLFLFIRKGYRLLYNQIKQILDFNNNKEKNAEIKKKYLKREINLLKKYSNLIIIKHIIIKIKKNKII